MKNKVTIYDIAKKLNITAATVSRALNDNPKISKKTRELVFETSREMNYKPNKVALALKSGKSKTIGVIVPWINRSFFSNVIRGIEDELRPFGYHVIICQTYDDQEREIETISTLIDARVDGILMSISNAINDTEGSQLKHINSILKHHIPLIFFDRKRDVEGVSSVTIDDFEGGYKATEHLIKLGCMRIAHLTIDCSLEIYQQRYEGYKQALADYDIPYDDDYFLSTIDNSTDAGRTATEKLIKLASPPDAIFASSDFVALGAIQELRERGIRIPDDFCVSGFSNEPFTKFLELSITSVDQFPLEMGKKAAQVFLEQVTGDLSIQPKKVVLHPHLIIRASSMKMPSKV